MKKLTAIALVVNAVFLPGWFWLALPVQAGDGGQAPSFIRGDCDNDGFVGGNVNDSVFYLNWAFGTGLDPECKAACDADGNGFVGGNVNDAVYYLNWAFVGGQPPDAPFPGCGPGTAADEVISFARRKRRSSESSLAQLCRTEEIDLLAPAF